MASNNTRRAGHIAYLRDVLKVPGFKEEEYLKVMSQYDSAWWLSNDPSRVALAQLCEPYLLVPMKKLQGMVEKVLGRPVDAEEFNDITLLRQEVCKKLNVQVI